MRVLIAMVMLVAAGCAGPATVEREDEVSDADVLEYISSPVIKVIE